MEKIFGTANKLMFVDQEKILYYQNFSMYVIDTHNANPQIREVF